MRTRSGGHRQRVMTECKPHRPKAGTERQPISTRNEPYLQFPHFLSKLVNWQVLDVFQQCLDFLEIDTTANTCRAPSDRVISSKQSNQRTLPDSWYFPWLPWLEIGRRDRYRSHHRRNGGSAPRPRWRPWRHWRALNICRRNRSRLRCPSSTSVPS